MNVYLPHSTKNIIKKTIRESCKSERDSNE